MEINLLRELVTVLSFTTFVGIVAYAVHPRNKARFEGAASSVLDEEETLTPRTFSPTPTPALPQGGGRKP